MFVLVKIIYFFVCVSGYDMTNVLVVVTAKLPEVNECDFKSFKYVH